MCTAARTSFPRARYTAYDNEAAVSRGACVLPYSPPYIRRATSVNRTLAAGSLFAFRSSSRALPVVRLREREEEVLIGEESESRETQYGKQRRRKRTSEFTLRNEFICFYKEPDEGYTTEPKDCQAVYCASRKVLTWCFTLLFASCRSSFVLWS